MKKINKLASAILVGSMLLTTTPSAFAFKTETPPKKNRKASHMHIIGGFSIGLGAYQLKNGFSSNNKTNSMQILFGVIFALLGTGLISYGNELKEQEKLEFCSNLLKEQEKLKAKLRKK